MRTTEPSIRQFKGDQAYFIRWMISLPIENQFNTGSGTKSGGTNDP